MPELPEVETIRRALEPIIVGRTIRGVETYTETLRSPLDQRQLTKALGGREIVALKRRAKYLLFVCSGDTYLLSHLGMTGAYRVEPEGYARQKHDRFAILLAGGDALVYNDIRKFGELKLVEVAPGKEFPEQFAGYAPEPLSSGFTGSYLLRVLSGIKAPVKTAIMRQELVVGVGNIYASEALFAAGISPLRPADTLSKEECALLVREIRRVLRKSLAAGGTTISDYRRPDGSEGQYALSLKAYGRDGESCLRKGCTGSISRIVQAGRSTFYCSQCQK